MNDLVCIAGASVCRCICRSDPILCGPLTSWVTRWCPASVGIGFFLDLNEYSLVEDNRTQQTRRKFTPQEKVAILRQHLLEGKPVSDVCDSHGLKPSIFYRWQKEFFENGAAAFEKTDRRTAQAQQRRTAELEARLKKKDNVIAEIMEDLINEKKRPGGL